MLHVFRLFKGTSMSVSYFSLSVMVLLVKEMQQLTSSDLDMSKARPRGQSQHKGRFNAACSFCIKMYYLWPGSTVKQN